VLKHFLKDGLESRDPSTRLDAIGKLDVSRTDDHSRLVELARADEDSGVRVAAVRKINILPTLFELKGTGEPAVSVDVLNAIQRRLEELVSSPAAASTAQFDELLAAAGTDGARLLAMHCFDAATRTRALALLQDQSDLAAVVIDTRYHTTRVAAAEQLESEAILESTAGVIKSRDKVVARSLQERLNAIRQLRQLQAEHQATIKQLVASCESLSGSVWSPQYAGRFTALAERWDRLDPAPDATQLAQFSATRSVCEALVAEHQQQAQAKHYSAEAIAQLELLTCDIAAAKVADLPRLQGEFRQRFSATNGGWRISQLAAEPADDLVARYAVLKREVSALLTDTADVQHLATEAEHNKPDPDVNRSNLTLVDKVLSGSAARAHRDSILYTDIAGLQKKFDSHCRQQSNEIDAQVKSVQKQLGALAASISERRWLPANALHSRIRKKLQKFDRSPELKNLQERLSAQGRKLAELGDWVDFAARPKLTRLCEQLEGLPGQALKPLELAAAIKAQQAEWKSIGMSPCTNELWPRFKAAGDTAFEPCAQFFAARNEERDNRTANKKKICEQLATYLNAMDWDTADWKMVEKTLRTAKNDWRNNRVADRKPDRALEGRFSALVRQFGDKLDVQYEQNAALKESLAEKAGALAQQEVSQHVVHQARRLQTGWKLVGIMRRKQDQELWERFNGFCRQIHKGHRDVQRQKSDSGLAHVNTGRDIIKQLRTLSRAAAPDEKRFAVLQDQFAALPEFPDKDRKYLLRDFNQASEHFTKLRDTSSARHAATELQELKRKSLLCQEYESLMTGADHGTDISELSAKWDDETTTLPKEWARKINARRAAALEHLKNHTDFDAESAEQERRLLCVRAEILQEKETPAEDKNLRMSYQLENLQQGLGNTVLADKKERLTDLQIDWLTLPPATPDNRERLELRFQSVTGF